jgi:hypothetical protein
MEYKESYAAKRKKNQEKRACLDNYNTYLYHSEVYKTSMDIYYLLISLSWKLLLLNLWKVEFRQKEKGRMRDDKWKLASKKIEKWKWG